MSARKPERTSTHRHPALAPDPDHANYATLLGWYDSPEAAAETVTQYQTAAPVSFDEVRGAHHDD